jgi:hypothetical protein
VDNFLLSLVSFEVSTVVTVQIVIFVVVTPCILLDGHQHFGGMCCLHVQGQSVYNEESVRLYRQIARKVVTEICGSGLEPGLSQ